MNIALWILQVLLAVHTLIGALWKFANPEQSVTSLQTIPHSIWLSLSVIEIFCALALVLPALKRKFARFVPVAAGAIAVEMLAFCAVHFSSGETDHSPTIYWMIVALIALFIAYGRSKISPIVQF